jgi:hypothetical protein
MSIVRETIKKLSELQKQTHSFQMFVGFDGYLDYIQHVVKSKDIYGQSTRFQGITDFAQHLQTLAGKSGQLEVSTQEVKIGGNAPILANALANLGIKNYCLGSMGFPQLHAEFKSMHALCELVTFGMSGITHAMEFGDGKLMFSDLGTFERVNWSYLKSIIGLEKIIDYIAKSQVIALVDWVNLPHATDIWRGILAEVVRPLANPTKHYLFDLCDPSKKSIDDITQVLNLISEFANLGTVTLGMNENETRKIWLALKGLPLSSSEADKIDLQEMASFIYQSLQVQYLLIHPTTYTIVCDNNGLYTVEGKEVKHPKVLTGGGDNLNAGYCLGVLGGFELQERALLGMATSGAYIQNGYSPSIQDLLAYLSEM